MKRVNDRQDSPIYGVLPLYIVIFIAYIGYSLKVTVLVPMLLYDKGEYLSSLFIPVNRAVALGIILSLYPLGQFLGAPVLGILSDRYGRRRVLLYSLMAASTCYAVLALALAGRNLPLFMVAMFLCGLSEANIVIAQSSIADVSTKSERSRLFGYVYLSAALAYVIGPLFCGRMADHTIVTWFDYWTPYAFVFILLVLTLILVYFSFNETRRPETRAATNFFQSFVNLKHVFEDKRLRRMFLVNFIIYMAIFGFFRSYPMYLVDEFKVSVRHVADMFALLAAPIVVGNIWLTGIISKRYSPRTMAMFSSFLMGIFIVLVVIPGSIPWLFIPVILTGFALAVAFPASAAMLSVMADGEIQGKVMGSNQSLQVAAETLSSVLAGILAAAVFELPIIVFSLLAGLAALLILLFTKSQEIIKQSS